MLTTFLASGYCPVFFALPGLDLLATTSWATRLSFDAFLLPHTLLRCAHTLLRCALY